MLTPPDHIHWARCDGATAVLDLHADQWKMFYGDGARIWDAITLRGSIDGLAEEIAIPTGGDLTATRSAIIAYIEQLCAMGLLVMDRPPKRTRWWRRR
ncbi:hypothetical protein HEK616_84120 (plasmid) [Streptomyces nigrescens]|uniref:PqqD family protein n=1 Tax=Streptomyces nigrescens TaxID=1920 RepID=A0ABM8A8R2_STRNI|nr:PqqD family protein [Streptomyces nigrescens]BDM74925.1 hypothetical protein HEK616_84120 [Streptomyces nigrescens]